MVKQRKIVTLSLHSRPDSLNGSTTMAPCVVAPLVFHLRGSGRIGVDAGLLLSFLFVCFFCLARLLFRFRLFSTFSLLFRFSSSVSPFHFNFRSPRVQWLPCIATNLRTWEQFLDHDSLLPALLAVFCCPFWLLHNYVPGDTWGR